MGTAAERLLDLEGPFAHLLGAWREDQARRACLWALLEHGQGGAIEEETWRRGALRLHPGPPAELDAALNSLVAEGVMVRRANTYRVAVPLFWTWMLRHLSSAARARSLGLAP